MSAAQPDGAPPGGAPEAATLARVEGARVEGAVGSQDALSGGVAASPAAAVNKGRAATSNSKELRAKEAEVDAALIAKAQTGDTAAFRSLVERHQRRAFAIALSLVHDENDAREIVQDAFLRVFKGLGTFQGGSSFFTWLYRIVTNLSIDLMRKPGRPGGATVSGLGDADGKLEGASDQDDGNIDFPLLARIDGSDPVDALRRQEIGARIQAALDALPPYHRSVIVMREVEGLSYDEMAHVAGVSKGTIMSRLFHARQKLQKALCDCYAEQVGAHPTGGGTRARGRADEGEEPEGTSDDEASGADGAPSEEAPSPSSGGAS